MRKADDVPTSQLDEAIGVDYAQMLLDLSAVTLVDSIKNARVYRDEQSRRDELERAVSALETTTDGSRARCRRHGRCVVADDGRGCAPDDPTGRLRAIGMRERIRLVGGRHEVHSTPGHETIVRESIPTTPIDYATPDAAVRGVATGRGTGPSVERLF